MSSLSALACENGDVNVGDGSGTESLGAALEDYQGTWEGYVEAFTFPDDSDRLKITLDENGMGQLVVGDSAAAPAPTDPEAAYPPGAIELNFALNPALVYPVSDAAVSDRRIRLNISEFAPYQSYCANLDPVWDPLNNNYSCGANDGSGGWRSTNCRGACVCTVDACTVYDFPPEVRFDGALTDGGSELSGTIILITESGRERMNARLFRQ